MGLKGYIVSLVVAAGAVGGGVYGWKWHEAHKAPDITYKTTPVEHKRIVGRITATGTLSAVVTVQVGTQVSGRVAKLFADFNSPVKKGDLIAKLDPELFQAALQQANANYASAKANVVKAEAQATDADRQYARAKALREQNLAAQQDVESAESAAAVAKASIDVAKAALAQAAANASQAKVNLSYTNISSPIDGVVISRNVDVGQTVAASLQAPVIFTIAEDLKKMHVDTNISEGDVGRLQPNMPAFFTVDAFPGQRFKGKIREIRNAAQTLQNVVTYDAVIDVDNDDLKLRPGMTANVTVTYADQDAPIAVANAALRFRPIGAAAPSASASARGQRPAGGGGQRAGGGGGGKKPDASVPAERTVYVLRGNDPAPVTVHTGLTDGSFTEIVDGDLHDGDAVITDQIGPEGTDAPKATPAPGGPGGVRRMF